MNIDPVRIVGVDPGLVHTGVVSMVFDPEAAKVLVRSTALLGPDAQAVARWIISPLNGAQTPITFIEGYRPRSHFDTDAKMVRAVADMKNHLAGSKVLNNTGVKKVVTQDLLMALGVWHFKITTHHQDLRSAARIALLGMFKDPELNQYVAQFVYDLIEGKPWDVRTG